jgi:hypothetical protein
VTLSFKASGVGKSGSLWRRWIAVTVLALAFAPVARSASEPPVDLSQAPPLPVGRLLGVASGDTSATFLVLDNAFKSSGVADIWAFEVFVPPIQVSPGKAVAQGLTHELIDCAKKTQTRLRSIGYDEMGTPLVMVLRGPTGPLDPGGAYDLISDMLCRGLEPPVDNVLLGHQAALTAARLIVKPEADKDAEPTTALSTPKPPAAPPQTRLPPVAAPK